MPDTLSRPGTSHQRPGPGCRGLQVVRPTELPAHRFHGCQFQFQGPCGLWRWYSCRRWGTWLLRRRLSRRRRRGFGSGCRGWGRYGGWGCGGGGRDNGWGSGHRGQGRWAGSGDGCGSGRSRRSGGKSGSRGQNRSRHGQHRRDGGGDRCRCGCRDYNRSGRPGGGGPRRNACGTGGWGRYGCILCRCQRGRGAQYYRRRGRHGRNL